VTAGAAALIIPAAAFGLEANLENLLMWCLFGGAIAQLVLVAIEITSHGTVSVEMATRAMTHGPYRGRFWTGVLLGQAGAGALALIAVLSGSMPIAVIAAIAAIVGLFAYEDAFVRAGQSVPLS